MKPWPGNLYLSQTDPDILLQVESVTANTDGFIVTVSTPDEAGDLIELAAEEWDAIREPFTEVDRLRLHEARPNPSRLAPCNR